jgi:hypothetical protein
MGYRKKYGKLRIVKYSQTPSGKKLKNKYAIVEGNRLVSAVCGITKTQAKKQLPYYQNCKVYVFTG